MATEDMKPAIKDTLNETVDYLVEALKFEKALHINVAGAKNIGIIPIPHPDGFLLTDSEKAKIIEECQKDGSEIVYQIYLRATQPNKPGATIIFSLTGNKVGYVPDNFCTLPC